MEELFELLHNKLAELISGEQLTDAQNIADNYVHDNLDLTSLSDINMDDFISDAITHTKDELSKVVTNSASRVTDASDSQFSLGIGQPSFAGHISADCWDDCVLGGSKDIRVKIFYS